jgi:hypothetical protein
MMEVDQIGMKYNSILLVSYLVKSRNDDRWFFQNAERLQGRSKLVKLEIVTSQKKVFRL